jgi:hypothetical protein
MGTRHEFICGTRAPLIVFQQIISLGGNCSVSMHIKRKFGGLVRSPFDWMITPYFSMCRVLEDEGHHLGMEFFPHKMGVACGYYGMIYYHEFPRVEKEIFKVNSATIAACRSKMVHKMSNLIEACRDNYRTLFIRAGSWGENDIGQYHEQGSGDAVVPFGKNPSRKVTISALNDLVSLVEKKFPNLDHHVVYINDAPDIFPDKSMDALPSNRLSIVNMCRLEEASEAKTSAESNLQWDEFFSAFNFARLSAHMRVDIEIRN